MLVRASLRLFLLPCLIVIVGWAATGFAKGPVHVKSYTKTDGTKVQSHYRSSPDGKFDNNWSTKGNSNPFNGKDGTRVTPPKSQAGTYGGGTGIYGSYADSPDLTGHTAESDSPLWIDNPQGTGMAVVPQSPVEPASGILRDVAATNYHGVGFSTTQRQFLQSFPRATSIGSADSVGVVTYAVEDLDGKRDAVWFQFLDDQLVHLVFAYGEPRLRQYGGTNVLLERAKQKFGPPTRESGGSVVWLFPAIDRMVMTENDENTWYLIVTQISAQKTVNAKRAQIDVGF